VEAGVAGVSGNFLDQAVAAIDALRAEGARVHCLTNSVAQNFTANVLLACGATPSMTVSPDEAGAFTRAADALLVNLGTLDADRRAAMPASIEIACAQGKPVVLDPVMCHLSPARLVFARQLLAAGPLILRANEAEAQALGDFPSVCRVATGPVDRISAPGLTCEVANGHLLMRSVVAMGCALGGLIAALATKAGDPPLAALAGLVWFGVAAEIAGPRAGGPGSFAPAFLDALAGTRTATIVKRAKVK
jgi:hydroxyethylthiazole kinase